MASVRELPFTNITELKEKFPNSFNYICSKFPTSVSIDGFYVTLHCSKTGYKLIYDLVDIEHFNSLIPAVNLTPKE